MWLLRCDCGSPTSASAWRKALAVASAWREVAVPADLCAIGEFGICRELRPGPRYKLRAAEARSLGFQRLLGPGPGAGRFVHTQLVDAIDAALW